MARGMQGTRQVGAAAVAPWKGLSLLKAGWHAKGPITGASNCLKPAALVARPTHVWRGASAPTTTQVVQDSRPRSVDIGGLCMSRMACTSNWKRSLP
jgi:hypothetical protein